jgi:hypothetical protein
VLGVYLGSKIDLREYTTAHDGDAVGEGAGGALGPARAATELTTIVDCKETNFVDCKLKESTLRLPVLGDMLVLVPGNPVGAVDIAPVEVSGELLCVDVCVGERLGDAFLFGELKGGVLRTATTAAHESRLAWCFVLGGKVDGEFVCAAAVLGGGLIEVLQAENDRRTRGE